MFKIKNFTLISLLLIVASCNPSNNNENIINKVNSIENQWINYNGGVELDNEMMQSQFIPYNSNAIYHLNSDAYVSFYNGENFIKTELHEAESELETVEKADGIIISFNKENKNGIKLINEE